MVNTRYFTLITLICLSSQESIAGGIVGFTFRGQMVSEDRILKKESEPEYNSHFTKFSIERARLDLMGNFSNTTKYRLRLRFDQSSDVKGYNQTGTIDYAYVSHQVSETFGVLVGKQLSKHGGPVGSFTPSDNSYYIHNSVRKLLVRTTGISLDYRPSEDHYLSLRISNPQSLDRADRGDEEISNPKSHSIGFVYNGKFGAIKPAFSYYISPNDRYSRIRFADDGSGIESESIFEKTENTYMGIGAAYETESIAASLSLLTASIEGKKPVGSNPFDDEKLKSIHIMGSYKFDSLKPRLFVESTAQERGQSSYDLLSAALVLEYFPEEDVKGLRYFAGATRNMIEFTDYNSAIKTETILGFTKYYLGLAIDADTMIP